jgi:periodic tryptophan protein 1
MISTAIFIPRGVAKEVPDRVEISPEELEMLIEKSNNMTLNDGDDTKGDADMDNDSDADNNSDNDGDMNVDMKQGLDNSRRTRGKKAGGKEIEILERMAEAEAAKEEAFLKELNMTDYDKEEEGATVFLSGANLTVFGSNSADPYITIPDEEDESDDEDLMLKPTDALLCVGRTEEEHSTIEFYVYDETTQNLYVHHDFVIPSFPLCLEWMGADPRSHVAEADRTQNFLAIGTFQPQIEIWNLDVLDVLEPVATLGGRDAPVAPPAENKSKKKKKKKKKKNLKETLLGKLKEGSHADAVMCMNWHPQHVNRLCSGSADKTIKLWDITTQKCMTTLTHHNDKVQAVKWNPSEPSVLLSGAYDRTVVMCDTRNNSSIKAKVDADIEAVAWNPHQSNQFFATTENGTVTCHDARKINDKPIFTIGAHSKPCTAIAINCAVPNYFATASIDKTVKLWDMTDNKVQMVASREMQVGSVFSMNFERNTKSPFLLVAGGNKGKVAVWDTTENDNVRSRYSQYLPASVLAPPVVDDDDE